MLRDASSIITCTTVFALLSGVGACALEDGEPAEHLRTADGSHSSPSADGGASHGIEADFNGDGYADLAIGVQREWIGDEPTGAVNVLYGSASGLSADDNQFWHRGLAELEGEPGSDAFGRALAAGDFNGDGYADLAIGAPFARDEAGEVHVLYGSRDGLSADNDQLWHQDQTGIQGDAAPHERLGSALATGDFDDDGYDDLAIGVPFDNDTGAVNVIYGSGSGLSADGNQRWDQDVDGVNGTAEAFDRFGAALAVGDFDGDDHDDLAIGVPWEGFDGLYRAGSVNVLYGAARGLSAEGDQDWNQDTPGIDGVAESLDDFGDALAAGDFDDDGFSDLAIGVPSEGLGEHVDAGAVNVIYGSGVGLHEDDDQFWHQDVPGVEGVVESDDFFGRALAAGDFDGDGKADLAIGVPSEDIGSIVDAGWINVLYGRSAGLHEDDDQVWHQDIPGVDGIAEHGDGFGAALTAGDFDGDGKADLAIGVPFEDVGDIENAGAANVLYGKRSGLHEDDDQVWHQDSPGVLDAAEADDEFGTGLR